MVDGIWIFKIRDALLVGEDGDGSESASDDSSEVGSASDDSSVIGSATDVGSEDGSATDGESGDSQTVESLSSDDGDAAVQRITNAIHRVRTTGKVY